MCERMPRDFMRTWTPFGTEWEDTCRDGWHDLTSVFKESFGMSARVSKGVKKETWTCS